jgi:hypothetical protein
MGVAIREGKLQSDFESKGAPQDGLIKIGDFAREYASRF